VAVPKLVSSLLTFFRRAMAQNRNIKTGRDYNEVNFFNQNSYHTNKNYVFHVRIFPKRLLKVWFGNYARKTRSDTEKKLLDKVEQEISLRLESSLNENIFIRLTKHEEPQQVCPSWLNDVKTSKKRGSSIFQGREDIQSVFQKNYGRLLILGPPGVGKTTTLLKLAETLIDKANRTKNEPIPVILNLSSWLDDGLSLEQWIVHELKKKHGVRADIGKKIIRQGKIIPLLDGLDELASSAQAKRIEKINLFLDPASETKYFVVCSRLKSYNSCQKLLELNSAVILQALTNEQIESYLEDTNNSALWYNICADGNLMELAKIPLFLNIMILSFADLDFETWKNISSSAQRLSYLFDAYINRMLHHNLQGKHPKREDTIRWLAYLAFQLEAHNETELFIEKIQPSWFRNKYQKISYGITFGLIYGSAIGVTAGFIGYLLAGREIGLSLGFVFGLEWFLVGVGLSLNIQRLSSFLKGVFNIDSETIATVETIRFSLTKAKAKKRGSIITGLLVSFIVGGFISFIRENLNGFWLGILIGMTVGITLMITRGLTGPEIDNRSVPNQGIRQSVKNMILLSIISAPANFILTLQLQLFIMQHTDLVQAVLLTLLIGFAFGLGEGGIPAIQHFCVRLICWISRVLPWNCSGFLDYATERLFLQRVGGGYRFIHKFLEEYFAQIYSQKYFGGDNSDSNRSRLSKTLLQDLI